MEVKIKHLAVDNTIDNQVNYLSATFVGQETLFLQNQTADVLDRIKAIFKIPISCRVHINILNSQHEKIGSNITTPVQFWKSYSKIYEQDVGCYFLVSLIKVVSVQFYLSDDTKLCAAAILRSDYSWKQILFSIHFYFKEICPYSIQFLTVLDSANNLVTIHDAQSFWDTIDVDCVERTFFCACAKSRVSPAAVNTRMRCTYHHFNNIERILLAWFSVLN